MKGIIINALGILLIFELASYNPIIGIIVFLLIANILGQSSFIGSFNPQDYMNTPPIIREWYQGRSIVKMFFLWPLYCFTCFYYQGLGLVKVISFYFGSNIIMALALFMGLTNWDGFFKNLIAGIVFGFVYYVGYNFLIIILTIFNKRRAN